MPFIVINGSKQGCVIALVLFAMYFVCHAEGVRFEFMTRDGLFNHKLFKAGTKTIVQTLLHLLVA